MKNLMKIFSPQMKIQNTKRKKNVKTVNSKLYCHIKQIYSLYALKSLYY